MQRCSLIVTSIYSSRLTSLLSLSLRHSLSLSQLLYKSITIAIPLKTKITNFKQIYPIYQMYNLNTS